MRGALTMVGSIEQLHYFGISQYRILSISEQNLLPAAVIKLCGSAVRMARDALTT